MENYKLKKAINFEGKEIKELNFNFENMTREQYKICEKEAFVRDPSDAASIPIYGETFRLVFAGMAAGVCTEAMFNLSVPDIIAISQKVQNFFFDEGRINLDFYKLIQPIEYKGEKINRLEFDFEKLGFRTYKKCKDRAAKIEATNFISSAPYNNETFLLCFAAEAAGMPIDFILKLSLRDSLNVALAAKYFLLIGGWTAPKEENQEEKTTQKQDTATA